MHSRHRRLLPRILIIIPQELHLARIRPRVSTPPFSDHLRSSVHSTQSSRSSRTSALVFNSRISCAALLRARVLSRVAEGRRLLEPRQRVARENRNGPQRKQSMWRERLWPCSRPFFNHVHQTLAHHHLVLLTLVPCSEFGTNNDSHFVVVALNRVTLLHPNCHKGCHTATST